MTLTYYEMRCGDEMYHFNFLSDAEEIAQQTAIEEKSTVYIRKVTSIPWAEYKPDGRKKR